ncbi:helix-turn-helix domain-containing protein [Nonomuraea turcica]|uniref:helix-turn-helix domain-containing protein n=1 Tax=Nonomuraea sp. G32 TaxID=3067274 RepID=UPI00352FFA72
MSHAGPACLEIARELGRAPFTISREIRRNRHPGNGQYRPHAAQARAVVSAGVRSRSVRAGARASPSGRRCMWATRPSTRPSTSEAAASCAVS